MYGVFHIYSVEYRMRKTLNCQISTLCCLTVVKQNIKSICKCHEGTKTLRITKSCSYKIVRMNKNIKINEQDIFRYIFSPHLLSEVKRKYLRRNEKYENQITYYESVKKAIDSETFIDLKKKIATKIPEYTLANVFTLHPVKYEEKKERNGSVIFAAKAKEEQLKIKTHTFTDDEKQFLVRIVNFESVTKIYLFPRKDVLAENINIKVFPGGEDFFMKDSSSPLEIKKRIDVESIELRIDG